MISPKSKRDREIYQVLQSSLSDKYHIHYKSFSITLEWSTLKIDFIIELKKEFLPDPDRPIFFYIQNGQNASMKKMTQIYDLLLSYCSVSIIWDSENVQEKLCPIISVLNEVGEKNYTDNFFSSNLKFLMFCDVHEEEETKKYREEVSFFTSALYTLEQDHGMECEDEEEVENEEGDDIDELLN